MLQFNELRIDESKNLIVDLDILDMPTIDPNKDIHIDHIYVGMGTNVETALIDCYNENMLDRIDGTFEHLRGFRLVLSLLPENYKKLIYIKVTTDTEEVDVPCTVSTTAEGYTYDKCLLSNKVFDLVKATGASCDNIGNYAHTIVQIQGLELAVEMGNFDLANKYWSTFFSNTETINISNCGCSKK